MPGVDCIYCREVKPASEYTKVEHVIPQSFGTFRENFTLLDLVCDECNQFFGDNLEVALARDTLEGHSRVDLGVRTPADFRHGGRRSRIRIKVAEGALKGAYVYRDYSPTEGAVTLHPVPQVGFRQTGSGDYAYYPLDHPPTEQELDELDIDLQHPESIRAFSVEVEELSEWLAARGIPFQLRGNLAYSRETTSLLCEVESTIDQTIKRATAKIAFNYLAYWEAGDFVRQASFDHIREFVRNGREAPYPLVNVSGEPILEDERPDGERRVGHLVTLNWASDGVSLVAQISLCNWFRYSVSLSRNYDGQPRRIRRGHFFDLGNRLITELSVADAS